MMLTSRLTSPLLLKSAAALAIAGAVLSASVTASSAQPYRHRGDPALAQPFQGVPAEPSYYNRPAGDCVQDEGQGRASPCDGGEGG